MTCPPLVLKKLWNTLVDPNLPIPFQFRTSRGILPLIALYASPIVPTTLSSSVYRVPANLNGHTAFMNDVKDGLLMTYIACDKSKQNLIGTAVCIPSHTISSRKELSKAHASCIKHVYRPPYGFGPCQPIIRSLGHGYRPCVYVQHPRLNMHYWVEHNRITSSDDCEYGLVDSSCEHPMYDFELSVFISTHYIAVVTHCHGIYTAPLDETGAIVTDQHRMIRTFEDHHYCVNSMFIHGSHLYVLTGYGTVRTLNVVDLQTSLPFHNLLAMDIAPHDSSLGVSDSGVAVLDYSSIDSPVIKWYTYSRLLFYFLYIR